MNRIVVIGVIFLFIASSVIPISGFNVEQSSIPVSNGDILYVGGSGPNNYTRIQDAIDDASDWDTVFVYDNSSPYYENLIVDKSINLIGENRDSTIIDGNENGTVVNIIAVNVTINGFTIQNSGSVFPYYYGLNLRSSNSIISNNSISDNQIGFRLADSNNNTITGNIIIRNKECGVHLSRSNNNIFSDNIISSTRYGIKTWFSADNISSNDISHCVWGLFVESSEELTISSNTVRANEYGIYCLGSKYCTISQNIITENNIGIGLFHNYFSGYTHNIIIFENSIAYNKQSGIFVDSGNTYQ